MTSTKTVNKTNCCVFGCHTLKMRENHVSFHLFPRKDSGFVDVINAFGTTDKVDRRKAWEIVLKMGKPASNYMRVCGKHFTKKDYLYELSRKPTLKKTAVPSQNLPKQSFAKEPSTGIRQQRLTKRRLQKEDHIPMPFVSHQHHVEVETQESSTTTKLNENERNAVDMLLNLQFEPDVDKNITTSTTADKEVQVKSGDLFHSYVSTISSDNHLNSLTGISDFDLLKSITSQVVECFPDSRKRKLCIEDRIILVFMKMKLAVKFKVLAVLFQITSSTCRALFNEHVQCIAAVLEPCIVWPSIDECRANMPNCFNEFKSTRLILDCTEIPIQKPKCRCCRIKTYSHYKGRNTLKFMTGVSPAGLLTFISTCYGGRASDKAIFEQSGVVNLLEPHIDSIMVDKGFAVQDICDENFIKVVQPYFLRKKKQFTAAEAKKNVLVSRARVHVERVNQRIRIFEIFNAPLPWNLTNVINDIFVIACGIVNLQSPILAANKFNK